MFDSTFTNQQTARKVVKMDEFLLIVFIGFPSFIRKVFPHLLFLKVLSTHMMFPYDFLNVFFELGVHLKHPLDNVTKQLLKLQEPCVSIE